MINLINISKNFHTKKNTVVALDNVNLHIEKGDIFGIIGYSGAGKSTLVRCINFLEVPSQGTVQIKGVDLSSLSQKELRKQRKNIGMIFQHFNLMNNINVFDNIGSRPSPRCSENRRRGSACTSPAVRVRIVPERRRAP